MNIGIRSKREERLTIEQEELRGISRTVAEIEWLLLILVLLYLAFEAVPDEARPAIAAGLAAYITFILAFHYANTLRPPARWKVALQTWAMIGFITWSAWFTGRLASPLLNAYLLLIITSALTLGKVATLCEMALIVACVLLLGGNSIDSGMFSLAFVGGLAAQTAPMILVAYVTTLFSADIRYGLNRAKLLSETDELTGLFNRRGFAILADRIFAQAARYNRPASLMMIDSDNLKAINDGHGHEAGDKMLQIVARCVSGELRQSDLVARYGGDEFVALLPETPPSGAAEVAERIREAVANTPVGVNGRMLKTSVSIGVASFPADGRTIDAVLEQADRAMYLAKRRGRDSVVRMAA